METAAVDPKPMRVLLLEDVPTDAEITLRELRKVGVPFVSQRVDTRNRFEKALQEFRPDLILSDFSLPSSFDGLAALDIARKVLPDIPYVFVSGTIGEDRAVEALKRGATDYVLKDRLNRLIPVIRRALEEVSERAARRQAEAAARESEEKLRLLIEGVKDYAMLMLDDAGRVVSWNPGAERIKGYREEEILGRHFSYFFPPEDAAAGKPERILRIAEETGRYEEEGRRVRKDGSQFWAHIVMTAIRDESGALRGYAKVTRDITEAKTQREHIMRLSRISAMRSGINRTIVRVKARDELFAEACRIIVEQGGFEAAWIGGVEPSDDYLRPRVWAGRDTGFLSDVRIGLLDHPGKTLSIAAVSARTRRTVVVNDVREDARVMLAPQLIQRGFLAAATLPLVVEDRVVGVLVFYGGETGCFDDEQTQLLEELASDISFALDHLEKAERLDYLAYYDGLTGLPNRTLFHEQVVQLVQSISPHDQGVAMMVLDLERFRRINETLGMAAGDSVLKQFAERLSDAVGEPSAVARISADRFAAAIVPLRNETEIARVIDRRILSTLSKPFRAGDQELHVPVKIGLAVYPGDGAEAAALYVNAEAALVKAKQSGERFLFYAPQMNARVAERLALENRLRSAIQEEQFVLHYQPKIDLATGKLAGLEALLRWTSPETGMVSPAQFIPILEETGMVLEVGRWVLRRAITDHATWCSQGLRPPRIAVNVSALQLRHDQFVADVGEAIEAGGESGRHIDLEITESMIMEDIDSSVRKLAEIRALGAGVSLDDFGTGYSSLSYIARLPVDTVKIDRSFVSTMSESAEHMAIVSAVISLSRALNLKVVAEGVETQEQSNLLRLLLCDQAQGYLYSPPLPPDKIAGLFATENP